MKNTPFPILLEGEGHGANYWTLRFSKRDARDIGNLLAAKSIWRYGDFCEALTESMEGNSRYIIIQVGR